MKKQLIIIGLMLSSMAAKSEAVRVPHDRAVRAIVGEACSEPWEVQVRVASAIRNRGTLKGVYGLNARHVSKQPNRVFRLASAAWDASAKRDYAAGCTMFGSVEDDWYFMRVLKLKPAFTVGKTRFYRSKTA